VKSGKPINAQLGKIKAVTTLCRLQFGVSEVCAVLHAVAVVDCLY